MSSKREKPKWQTLDNFFTKAPVPSTQDHDHNTPTNSDSHAETPSNNIDSVTSKIDDEVCSNPTTMSKPIHKNLPSYPDISTLKDSVILGKDVKFQLLTGSWKDVHTFKFRQGNLI
jgi:hypothetical protein